MDVSLSPGFNDPVGDAQACFRAILDAMARPGQVHQLPDLAAPPAPLCNAAAGALLTLVDFDTPLWLDDAAAVARPWISFHTGAPSVPADRALFAMALSLPDLTEFPNGTDEMPEASATVILQVASLSSGRRLILSGPGLRDPAELYVDGLHDGFAAIWARNHVRFPLGIDLILCTGNRLAALPRSVTVGDP